jgi:hypothetical protein
LQICGLGFNPDEAALMLRKAHGWGFQGYWRNERDCAAPSAEDVAARITFLRDELALSEEALRKVLLLFPEALGLDIKQRMRPNVVRRRCRRSTDARAPVSASQQRAKCAECCTRARPPQAFLERTYKLAGPTLAAVLERKPNVLGNSLDCAGDCVGECNRCWARF